MAWPQQPPPEANSRPQPRVRRRVRLLIDSKLFSSKTSVESWAKTQYELVTLAAEFADSPEWILTGSPTAAHWLAIIADVEACTTREWIRIGRKLADLAAIADAFKTRAISYCKVRTLTRLATSDNEHELLAIATTTTAAGLGRALAAWLHRNSNDEDLAEYHQQQRSVKWRTEPDGMVSFSLRLPPLLAGILITLLTTWVMRARPAAPTNEANTAGEWPTVAQQHADALGALVTKGGGTIDTEVVVHVRGDSNTLDDGTPLPDRAVASLIPTAFISALLHDAKDNPIDATNRNGAKAPRQRKRPNMHRLRTPRTTRIRPHTCLRTHRPHHHHRTPTPLRTLPPQPTHPKPLNLEHQRNDRVTHQRVRMGRIRTHAVLCIL